MEPTRVTDELALKIPLLETEVRGLRQLLDEVKSNLDELRRERLAERAEQRAWFCGRASTTG